MQRSANDDVLVRKEGRAGRITLNRPKALNALTFAMVGPIWDALAQWKNDPGVELVLLDGAGDKALCAGGDVRSLYDSRDKGSGHARDFWRNEYRLNALIGRYPKPYIAIQHGIVMGGGIGLSGHARYRVVTEHSQLAMPETSIGLIPDVGGTWLLGHAPGEVGTYLGLTGTQMGPGDAIYAGFSDRFVPAASIETLKARLLDRNGGPIEQVLANLSKLPSKCDLERDRSRIDRAFKAETIEEILEIVSGLPGEWANKTASQLATKSPKSLKLTLAAIRNARRLPSLEAALNVEYRLAVRLFEDGEFTEGVRALIIDKDRNPRWSPARPEEVHQTLIDSYLAPLPSDEELRLEPGTSQD